MSKRFVAASAIASVGLLALIASASAQTGSQAGLKTYSDPQSRFTIQHPSSWPVDPLPGSNANNQGVVIGIADAECKVVASRSDQSAGKSPEVVRNAYRTAIGDAAWKAKADAFAVWGRRGVVKSSGVDAAPFWPVQTAEFTTDDGKPGFARLHARPGVEVWMFCNSFDDRDRTATFNQIFSSFAAPNDAQMQADAEAAVAQQAAAEAAAEAQKARQGEKKKR
jgi:hypothetical protein